MSAGASDDPRGGPDTATDATAPPAGGRRVPDVDWNRALATAGVALLSGAYLRVLYDVSDVTGDPVVLLLVAAVAVVAATVLARYLAWVPALGLTSLLVAAGGYAYVATLPTDPALAELLAPVATDTVALLTGLSVFRIVNAGFWALAITPGPTFLAWYLAVRERFVPAVVVAGSVLGLFVLTGDAALPTALLGTVGGVAAVGFGDITGRSVPARDGGDSEGVDRARRAVMTELAGIVVVTQSVKLVPGGENRPLTALGSSNPSGETIEASLTRADSQVDILGPISLSPEVRFSVVTEAPRYWKVGAYDRFTGGEWIRTGSSRPYEGPLAGPPGPARSLEQTVRAEAGLGVLPAAWKPTEFRSGDVEARVTATGDLEPVGRLPSGGSYTVESRVPDAPPEDLREAGRDYPPSVAERYTQLPASTPDRVADRTARITANATNPYDTARVVEQWLANNKRYSLGVERPDGNVADAFLFEMSAGYCTYFATTMVAMLRTQDIPARLAVGYTPGERVARDRWVVRGLDSHAWVEVFFPGVGWTRFDPTPAGPRSTAERARLERARENGEPNVDTGATAPNASTSTPTTPTPTTPTPAAPNASDLPDIGQTPAGRSTSPGGFGFTPVSGDGGGSVLPDLPSREQLGLGLVVVAGVVAGVRSSGVAHRAYREVWLRVQPRADPATDVERAYERLEYLLGRRHRRRRPGETPRQYLRSVGDDRARRVGTLYERARYAGRVDEAAADEAVELVDELVAERSRFR